MESRSNSTGFIAVALLASVSLCSAAGAKAQIEAASPQELEVLNHLPGIAGDYFRYESDAVGRGYHIYVSLPQSYGKEPARTYPVVYVLDGDSLFPIIAPTHLFLAFDYDLPEAVIVGIAYGSFEPPINRRGFDYTVVAADKHPRHGGAAAFHAFLKDELAPTVAERYRVDTSRQVLFGQSRGGGMVLYSAFVDPDLFWGRIASNPTFEPGRELFFATPPASSRDDLALVVTSGTDDRPILRQRALEWFEHTAELENLPWSLYAISVAEGRHASFSPSSYRMGMLRLFDKQAD